MDVRADLPPALVSRLPRAADVRDADLRALDLGPGRALRSGAGRVRQRADGRVASGRVVRMASGGARRPVFRAPPSTPLSPWSEAERGEVRRGAGRLFSTAEAKRPAPLRTSPRFAGRGVPGAELKRTGPHHGGR